jgi:membrane protease YdiL (CAAX protease family)
MTRRPLLAFFLITFGISWGIPGLALLIAALTGAFEVALGQYDPLWYLVVWSPAIAALVIIGVMQGRTGLTAYGRRLLHFRAKWAWVAGILLGIPMLNLLASLLTQATGRPALVVPSCTWTGFAVAALLCATAGPFEELGWRGFALPLLQRRHSGLRAAIILGLIWGLWHVPGLVVSGAINRGMEGALLLVAARVIVGCVAGSVIMTVIYNATGGSVPVAFFFHWMGNLPYPWEGSADISAAQGLLWIVAALALFGVFGRRYLGTENLHTEVTPG